MSGDKFKATVDYLIHSSPDALFKGATMLNKVLWNADVTAYKTTGRSITGGRYVRRQNGPVPEFIMRTLGDLKQEGRVQVIEPRAQFDSRKYLGLGNDDGRWSVISSTEREIIRDQVARLSGMSAMAMSDETHGLPWQCVPNGEIMPLSVTLVEEEGDYPLSGYAWAEEIIEGIENHSEPIKQHA